jgi:YidC/Oxa1 family membrane protein insertase
VDLFAFAPLAALLNGAYVAVQGLVSLLAPIAGPLAAAAAILALTLLVRAALIPVGVSQVKAEGTRRRLAPKLQALRKRYAKNPQLLAQRTQELYKAENASQFAGILPALAQLPVIAVVYALFERATIGGHANALLTQKLFGVPLGDSFLHTLGGSAPWPGALLYLALFVAMGAVAWMTRRTQLRLALPDPGATSATATMTKVLSWMPFLTIAFAAVVPLAATLYLTVTTAWTLVERMLLRRRLWNEQPASAPARLQTS